LFFNFDFLLWNWWVFIFCSYSGWWDLDI
jgi:hypothetical protein